MRTLYLIAVLLSLLCLARAQMDLYTDDYQLYAVVDADDIDAYDIQQFGFGGAGFGGSKGLAALRNPNTQSPNSTHRINIFLTPLSGTLPSFQPPSYRAAASTGAAGSMAAAHSTS